MSIFVLGLCFLQRLGGLSYFAGAEKKDERVLVPDLGSLTNIYDRARELFYYLKRGQVDYGEEHSKACGHPQFGRICEKGHYPEWDADHPIHFVGHSAGAQVVRVLQQMLADKAFKGHKNTSEYWVLSLTSLSGAFNGTTRSYLVRMQKPPFSKKQADLFFPPDFSDDFPVAMQISHKYSSIYVITKLGLLFVYDLETATAVYRNKISPDPIFLTSEASSTGGFYAINRHGQVLLATVNESTIVPFVSGQLNNLEFTVNLAKRGNLPGAENLEYQVFDALRTTMFILGMVSVFIGISLLAPDEPRGGEVKDSSLASVTSSDSTDMDRLVLPTEDSHIKDMRSLAQAMRIKAANVVVSAKTACSLTFGLGEDSIHASSVLVMPMVSSSKMNGFRGDGGKPFSWRSLGKSSNISLEEDGAEMLETTSMLPQR